MNRIVPLTSCLAMLLVLAGCGDQRVADRSSQSPPSLQEITELYHLAAHQHHQAQRQPVRNEQARAMRMLSEKLAVMQAQTQQWEQARLTSADPRPAQADVQQFRGALEGMKTAADKQDRAALGREYHAMVGAYRNLTAQADVVENRPK